MRAPVRRFSLHRSQPCEEGDKVHRLGPKVVEGGGGPHAIDEGHGPKVVSVVNLGNDHTNELGERCDVLYRAANSRRILRGCIRLLLFPQTLIANGGRDHSPSQRDDLWMTTSARATLITHQRRCRIDSCLLPAMSAYHLSVSHRGKTIELSALPDSTLESLQLELESLTLVQPAVQKLLYKGKKITAPDGTIADAGLKDGSKITLLGSTQEELGGMHVVEDQERRRERILRERATKPAAKVCNHASPAITLTDDRG